MYMETINYSFVSQIEELSLKGSLNFIQNDKNHCKMTSNDTFSLWFLMIKWIKNSFIFDCIVFKRNWLDKNEDGKKIKRNSKININI